MLATRIERRNKMLEEKKYPMAELTTMFGCKTRQQLKNKLNNYGIQFEDTGRGAKCQFDIKRIQNPFKVFAILEMKVSPQTDFNKFRNFCYFYLNDEDFRNRPDTLRAAIMGEEGEVASRQTISNYENYFERANYVCLNSGDYRYYFVNKDHYKETDRETYNEAWRTFFEEKESEEKSASDCFASMYYKYGGIAKKHSKPEFNAFYTRQVDYLNELVCEEMEKTFNFESEN